MNLLQTTDIAELLPVDAAERLRALRRTRDDAGAIMRSIVDRVLETRATRQEAETRLRSLTKTVRPLPADHPSVVAVQRTIDNAGAELLRLANHEAITAATFNHAARLVTTTERWARDHASAGRMFGTEPTIEPRLLKGENVVDGIERNRRELRRLEADLHAARSAPIPSTEAKAAMREQLAALSARGRPYVEGLIEHGEAITFAAEDMRTIARGEQASFVGWTQFDALATFAWLHQDSLVKRLSIEIDAAADDGAALSAVDRKRREAELLGDIAMTQKQVAALIRLAETEGIAVEFEVDCPPEIMLGVVVVEAPPAGPTIDHAEEVLRQHRAVQAAGADPQALTKALVAGMPS